MHDGRLGRIGAADVALDDGFVQILAETDPERIVQAFPLAELLDRLLRGQIAEDHLGGVTGRQVEQQEHAEGYADQHWNEKQHAAEDIA